MEHHASHIPQSAADSAEAVMGNLPWVGEVTSGVSTEDHSGFLLASSLKTSSSGLDYFNHQNLLERPMNFDSSFEELPQSRLNSFDNHRTSWPTTYSQDGQWSEDLNQYYTDSPSAQPMSNSSSHSFLDVQTPPVATNASLDQNPNGRDVWTQPFVPQVSYPISPNEHRGLPRRRSRYSLQRNGSKVTPTFIPNPLSALNPMQRWQESPPEDEPASMSAIMNQLENYQPANSQSDALSMRNVDPFRGYNSFEGFRPPASTPSSYSSAPSVSSHHSVTSARSGTSKRSLDSGTHSNRLSARRARKEKAGKSSRRFCCTFCCDKFRTKYDWARHEKSLHMNLESWVCAPHGASFVSPLTGRAHCAYCNILDPKPEHLDEHNYQACMNGTRSFRRKDHLVQHLRLTHYLDTVPLIDDWKRPAPVVTSRCGFCDRTLSSWDDRVDHLASHFRNGSTMDDWKGEHEFPPEVASHVTNFLPPYYLGGDSRCLVPFSATNIHARDHVDQVSAQIDKTDGAHQKGPTSAAQPSSDNPFSSMLELLASHLGQFTRTQLQQGVVPTDEMLQQESRRLVYGSEDDWNQTIFDNPQWLATFRRQHIEHATCPEPGEQPFLSDLNGFSFEEHEQDQLHWDNTGS